MKKSTIILLISMVVLIAGATVGYNLLLKNYKPDAITPIAETGESTTSQSSGSSTAEGNSEAPMTLAPDFTVYDKDGNAVKLSDYTGTPVVINFWATWCGYCVDEMADFEKVYSERGNEVQFLMINWTDGKQETQEKAEKFMETNGYTMPTFFDTDQNATYTYGISGIPKSYFIDKDGYLLAMANGAIDEEALTRGIDMITGK